MLGFSTVSEYPVSYVAPLTALPPDEPPPIDPPPSDGESLSGTVRLHFFKRQVIRMFRLS